MNKGVSTAFASIGIAQFLKIPIKKISTGKWDWRLFFETGGMPSSHSAGVAALASFIAVKRGVSTTDFALSTIFGLIVMYDAQGVRRQTGELSIKVNDLEVEVERIAGMHPGYMHRIKEKKLKEMLGHQPKEVLGGALLGIVIGAISAFLDKNKNKCYK